MKNLQENKNSIWILNHYAITPDMPGGTRHYDFGRELVKRGYGVTVFASSFHYLQNKELKLAKNEKYKVENINGINFVWIKTFSYKKNDWKRVLNMISYMWQSYWIGRKISRKNLNIKKPNIIIGSSVHLLAVLSAYWLSKYHKAKFVMEVRDLWPQTLIDVGKFKKSNPIIKILRFLEKFLYKRAKKIIVLMPFAEKYISLLGINKDKIIWISNGVDISKFKRVEEKKESDQYFKTIYFGAHGIANALDVILDTAKTIQGKEYKDIKFIFIGDGEEKKRLIDYSKKLKIENAEFWNPVVKKDIPLVLAQAGVLIISQKSIGLYKYGISFNKLFDYMAAAKPIVFGGNPVNNLVREANCGISVPPENSEKMAKAIIGLYKMLPEEREKMGRRGREYVEKYYSISILVDKLEKVIKEINNE